jgi:hypothetical protein
MKTFEELETDYGYVPVRPKGFQGIAGTMTLAKRDTTVDFAARDYFNLAHPELKRDENGWFEVEMLGPGGQTILAHNAVVTKTSQHAANDGASAHQASIFPNFLIFDKRGLNKDNLVESISCKIHGLKEFFKYQVVESLACHDLSEPILKTLAQIRYNPDEPKDFFAPRQIFILHDVGEVLEFRVDDRTYSIWVGGKSSFAPISDIKVETYPIATITFDQPVTIDEAVDCLLYWKKFFSQVSMQPLKFEGISVTAGEGLKRQTGNLYSPFLASEDLSAPAYHKFNSDSFPLNSWKDRIAFGDVMRSWLSENKARQAFRARLDSVIERMDQKTDQMLLIELSAAIDSLNELKGESAVQVQLIDTMVHGAKEAASTLGVDVSNDRLKGILSQLQQRSLGEKMKELCLIALPDAKAEDIDLIVKFAKNCRNDAVHRGAVRDKFWSLIGPTTEALAAACVAFDLQTCGMPYRAVPGQTIHWQHRFSFAVDSIREQESRSSL